MAPPARATSPTSSSPWCPSACRRCSRSWASWRRQLWRPRGGWSSSSPARPSWTTAPTASTSLQTSLSPSCPWACRRCPRS
eukprot:6398244-Heterocapsa_arctica.AAC.1